MKKWDIIGDIHGQAGKLEALLGLLGYIESNGVYRHPERRVLFLGDYIDRGPDIRGVLHTVRAMVDAGEAVALMGNHELNALHYHTKGPDGCPLRSNKGSKRHQHAATLDQFTGYEAEWQEWLVWFAQLPLYHESEDFRAIHACWSDAHLDDVRGCDFRDPLLLAAAADKNHLVGRALQVLLKGPEVKLPEGAVFPDKDGHKRDTLRVRWWGLSDGDASYRSLIMPPRALAPDDTADPAAMASVPDYPEDAKTVFCGHYWLPYEGRTVPLTGNIMCMDYSAGRDGPLVACRWSGSLEKSDFHLAETLSL
ncbi:MAG: metallophosphoesterase [Chthoniobacterales bacterium]